MKIELNESTKLFIGNCIGEIQKRSQLNGIYDAIDKSVLSKPLEKQVLTECKDIDFNIKGFKRNASTLTKNEYYKNISLKNIDMGNVKYQNKILPARTVLRMNYPEFCNKYGGTHVELGYYDKNVNIPMLLEGDKLWMSITEMEIKTSKNALGNIGNSENILIFGLGLGYFPYMCSLIETTKKITIVENNEKIINLFNTYILPQFKYKDKIEIIHADMFELLNKEFTDKYDYIYVDTWENDEDGLRCYKKIVKTDCNLSKFNFWIEDAILLTTVLLIIMHFKGILYNTIEDTIKNLSGDYNLAQDYKVIADYFDKIDLTISTGEELSKYINDKTIIREILKQMN